jgi:hypothetical protein
MRTELLKHTWSGMAGTATTTQRTGAIATKTLGAMEAQRREAAVEEEGAGIWATGFSLSFFSWFQDWRALGLLMHVRAEPLLRLY